MIRLTLTPLTYLLVMLASLAAFVFLPSRNVEMHWFAVGLGAAFTWDAALDWIASLLANVEPETD